jgi:hypothetical protein
MTQETLIKANNIQDEISSLEDIQTELSCFEGKIESIKIEGEIDNVNIYKSDISGHSIQAMRSAMSETVTQLIEGLREEFDTL